MPNNPSSKKRLRQNEKLRVRNRAARTRMRTHLRQFREAVQEGNGEKALAAYRAAQKILDKAAANNLIHRNTASRTKSRLVKMLKAVG
jgi:small subunit ribosomal protein S20